MVVSDASTVIDDHDWVGVDHCPLCGTAVASDQTFERVSTQSHTLSYLLCPVCGLVYQSPRLRDGVLARFYERGYRSQVQGEEEPSRKDQWAQTKRAHHLLSFITPLVPAVRFHLDIGSSLGEFLLVTREQYGCEVYGVEPGERYRQASSDRGLAVAASLLEVERRLAGSFDLVSLIHVLEHLPDPVRYLEGIRTEWLAPEGFLLAEVPNLYGHPCLELAHLMAFTKTSLRATLEGAGFAPIRFRLHGQPYSRWLRPFITVLAKPANHARLTHGWAPPIGLTAKRRMGLWLLGGARAISKRLLGRKQLRPWE